MLDDSIKELESRSLERIASAGTAEELEAVRVEALGRKGGLTQFSKEMGKLAPEERWAVIAYVRALERARNGKAADVADPAERKILGLQ